MAVPLTLSSVPAQTPYVQYIATASQTVFPYPFEITQDSDLVCLINGVQQATDGGYTLSGQGNTTGGFLTFTVGQTAGTIITLYRNIVIARITQFAQNGTFFSANFNNEFNRIYLIMQQLQQSLGGSSANLGLALMVPSSNNPAPTALLTPAAYANKYLSFDANGNPQPALLTSAGTVTAALITSLLNPATNTLLNSVLDIPQTAAEAAASVTPTNTQYLPGQPERYIASGFAYASNTAGAGGTDFSTAINTALGIGTQPVLLGPFLYAIHSTITVPPEQKMSGAGLNETGLCCVAASWTGSHVLIDNGSAEKIELRGFYIYGNSITADGINLGNSGTAYGTEGYLDQLFVRGVSGIGFNINGNIGEMGALYADATAGIKIVGSGNSVEQMENTAATGFADVNSNQTATEFQDGAVHFFECEAPATGILLLTVNGQAAFENFIPALAPSTTFSELIYITNNASNWRVNVPVIYYGGSSGTFSTFTNLFYEQASAVYYGVGNTVNTGSLQSMCADYKASMFITGGTLAVKKQQLNAFTLRVTSPVSTIQHAIGCVGSPTTATNFATSVPNGTHTLTNTPTGTDSSTAMANGGKISSAATSVFILDTGAEVQADSLFMAQVTNNNTGTAYTAIAFVQSNNVNGVTQSRLCIQLVNPTSAAAVAWSTALTAGSGVLIDVNVFGFFK